MCKKKILGAVIGTALAIGAGAVYAAGGTLEMVAPLGSSVNEGPTYAKEQFAVSGDVALGAVQQVKYTIKTTTVQVDVHAKFKLSSGKWKKALTSSSLVITSCEANGNQIPGVTIIDKGGTSDSEVTFWVQASSSSKLEANCLLTFSFEITEVYALASSTEITVTAELVSATSGNAADDTKSLAFAKSTNGVTVKIVKDKTPGLAIDVARGTLVFAEGIDDTTAKLGTIDLKSNSKKDKTDGASTYTFNASEGTLTITNGPFNASTGANMVFIDFGADGSYTDTGIADTSDIAATVSDDLTTAIFKFTAAQLKDRLYAAGAKNIVMKVDGTTIIDDIGDPPIAAFKLKFATDVTYSGKLAHIEQNGSVCKLFNIPSTAAIDLLNIRVYNRTATENGAVFATLYDESGAVLFENQTLIEDLLAQTVERKTAADIEALLTANPKDPAVTTWSGRAVLVLSSPITNMEAFEGLRSGPGQPLMNLSVGGSGSGCD